MRGFFCRCVDTINARVARVVSWLIIPMVFIVMTEVTCRYFLNSPTLWAWDTVIMTGAIFGVMGGGNALRRGNHVSVDIVAKFFPPRVKAIVDLATSPIFFVSIGMLLWFATEKAIHSVAIGERYVYSMLEPPLSPIRIAVAIGIFLLLIQGVVKFIRDLSTATRSGREGMS